MDKFYRNFVLSVETIYGTTIEIKSPLTLVFDIVRNVNSSASRATIQILNLNPTTRESIKFDFYDYGNLKKVSLRAGYGTNLPEVFFGQLKRAYSVREGTEFVTTLECESGGFAFANATFSDQFPEGTNFNAILESMIGSLPGVSVGAIGDFSGPISKGAAYNGNTTDILRDITGGAFFVDNGKAYCLKDNECIEGDIDVISSASGLLGTPALEETYLTFDMIFEPRVKVGQKIKIESITAQNFSSFYRVNSIKHKGMISDAVCGAAITTLGMWYGASALKTVT